MKRRAMAAFKRVARLVQTRIGQKANRVLGGLVASQHRPPAPRIARQVQQQLWQLGYLEQSYQTCLLTEAQCLRAEAAYGPPNAAWAGVMLPATRLIAYQLRRNLLAPLQAALQPLRTLRSQHSRSSQTQSAGLFEGMGYSFRSSTDCGKPDPERYAKLTAQARALLATYRTIQPEHHGRGAIGILISCYKPERHIAGFLSNLLSLEQRDRLVPVVINAGMSEACALTIQTALATGGFRAYHVIDLPGSAIYTAWNAGIKALGNSVEYITNFNVDDRRHPLCLNIQAECLSAFPQKKVAVTDYSYFFEPRQSIDELFSLNSDNTTLIPAINERTLVDGNLPHSSPMWRRSLHQSTDCGLFDESFRSAGDAEFWYRVSQRHANAFSVISIPLSLYYQNPEGLSTRPRTAGLSEHSRCTRDHYRYLTEQMDASISPEFARLHIQLSSPEHMQLYALASALKEA
jgi:hypothetical protein